MIVDKQNATDYPIRFLYNSSLNCDKLNKSFTICLLNFASHQSGHGFHEKMPTEFLKMDLYPP